MSRESTYGELKLMGEAIELPSDDGELHRLALEMICSKGVPSHLTPYGSVRSVAAFAIGARDDPFYRDGEVLLKAAVARRDRRTGR